jgi:hypothetical protein
MPQPGQSVCRCYYCVAASPTVSAIFEFAVAVVVAFLVCHPRRGSASVVVAAVVVFTRHSERSEEPLYFAFAISIAKQPANFSCILWKIPVKPQTHKTRANKGVSFA